MRLFLNRGEAQFEEVTEAAGLVGLPTKGPHVELNDMDNDGWPDLVATASAADGTRPAVFRHTGLNGDIPMFSAPEGLGSPQYWVAGPTADIDRDGRLDVFLVEFDPALPSLMLRNETASGHWLEVSMGSELGSGLGWRIEVYEVGAAGDASALLGAREITTTQGYSSGVAPVAHFGLGDHEQVDVRLNPPGDGEMVILEGVTGRPTCEVSGRAAAESPVLESPSCPISSLSSRRASSRPGSALVCWRWHWAGPFDLRPAAIDPQCQLPGCSSRSPRLVACTWWLSHSGLRSPPSQR